MLRLILLVFTPILSLVIFTLGSGFLTTLLTVNLHAKGGGTHIIGIITAVYYFGLVLGAFRIGRYIRGVGHIRVYSAFASILTITIILQGLFVNDIAWIFFRFITGFATAGIYIAIESWILVVVSEKDRGKILSLYMMSFYAALASGQFLLNIGNSTTIIPFCIIAMLFSLSIVPLSMTRAVCPKFEDITALSLRKLYKISPSGIIACLSAGLITSSIYGFMPLLIKQLHWPNFYVSVVMSSVIAGAMIIQYPIGHLSDRIGRRILLIILSFTSLSISLIMIISINWMPIVFLVFIFIFGGVSFSFYPVGISLMCDYLTTKDIVPATQGLLLANSIGSIIGPLLVPEFMNVIGPLGLFIFFAMIMVILGIFFLWSRTKRSAPSLKEQQEFIPISTPSVSSELNPRIKD